MVGLLQPLALLPVVGVETEARHQGIIQQAQ